MKDVIILTHNEESEFTKKVAEMLAEEGIAFEVSPSEDCAKAVLAVLDAKETVNVKVAAKALEYIGRGVPVFSICPECECCACSETVDMLKKLFGAEPVAEAAPEIEIEIFEEPAIEEPAIEEPVVEEPVVEELAIEASAVEEPTLGGIILDEATVNLEPVKSAQFCDCGVEIDSDMAFCWGCGKRIEVPVVEAIAVELPVAETPAAEVHAVEIPVVEAIAVEEPVVEAAATPKCSCGAEILPDTLFCWACGKKVEAEKADEPAAPETLKCICGADIAEGTLFCWQCGKRVGEDAPVAPAAPVTPKCPSCGADITSGDKFCFSCGTPL